MSTSGKGSIRKDKNFNNIGAIFEERDEKKAALDEPKTPEAPDAPVFIAAEVPAENTAPDNSKPAETKKTKGRGEKATKKTYGVFVKEQKKKFQQKSVYLSTENIEFIKEHSEIYDMPFSEVLNQIVENFRENLG